MVSTFLPFFSSSARVVKESVEGVVKNKVQHKAELFVDAISTDVGTAAARKFHDVIYKNNDLVGRDSSGNEVGIYRTDVKLVENLVKKVLGVDLKQNVVVGAATGPILKKLDAYLVKVLAKKLEGLTEDFFSKVITEGLYKGAGIHKKSTSLKPETKEVSSFDDKKEIADLSKIFNVNPSDLKQMYEHYEAKLNLYINNLVETNITEITEEYSAKLADHLVKTSEDNIASGVAVAATAVAAAFAPEGVSAVVGVMMADDVNSAKGGSYLKKFSEYAIGSVVDIKLQKANLVQAAKNSASILAQKIMPKKLAVDEKKLEAAYGTFEAKIHEYDEDFMFIEQEKKPMSFDQFLANNVAAPKLGSIAKGIIKMANALETVVTGANQASAKVELKSYCDLSAKEDYLDLHCEIVGQDFDLSDWNFAE